MRPHVHAQNVNLLDYANKNVFYRVGQVIFNLHLAVSHLVLCQMKGASHAFSIYHIFKCSEPPPPCPYAF